MTNNVPITPPTREEPRPGRTLAYIGVVVGGGTSIAANIAHSYVPPTAAPPSWPLGKPWNPAAWTPPAGAVIFAVLWPAALLIVSEIMVRIDWPQGWRWILLRFAGLLPVAAVAAIISYKHLSALLAYYGEDRLNARIGPLSVDGLMVMATGALLAVSGHHYGQQTDAYDHDETASDADPTPDGTPDTEPASRRTSKRRTAEQTATAIGRLRDRQPDMPVPDIAKRLKVSERTVRRHLPATTAVRTVTGVNGSPDTGTEDPR